MLSRIYSNIARAANDSPPLKRFLNTRSKAQRLISDSDSSSSTETIHATIIPFLPRDVDPSYYAESSVPERPKWEKEIASPSPSPRHYYAYYVTHYRIPTPRLKIGNHIVLVITIGLETIMALAIVKGFSPHASHSHYLAYVHVDTCFYSSTQAVHKPNHCSTRAFYQRGSLPRFADGLVPLFVPYDEHDADIYDPMPHCIREWSTVSVADWPTPICAIANFSASCSYPDAFRPYLIAERDLDLPSGIPPPTKYPIPAYGRLNLDMYNEAEALPYNNRLIPKSDSDEALTGSQLIIIIVD